MEKRLNGRLFGREMYFSSRHTSKLPKMTANRSIFDDMERKTRCLFLCRAAAPLLKLDFQSRPLKLLLVSTLVAYAAEYAATTAVVGTRRGAKSRHRRRGTCVYLLVCEDLLFVSLLPIALASRAGGVGVGF